MLSLLRSAEWFRSADAERDIERERLSFFSSEREL